MITIRYGERLPISASTESNENTMSEVKELTKSESHSVISSVMQCFSHNYKREKHPIVMRLLGIWRIITCRNFILIDFYEQEIDGKAARKVRPLYQSDYDSESEFLSLKAALLSKMEAINRA